VLFAGEELQREQRLELTAVDLDGRTPIELLQRHLVFEAGLTQTPFEAELIAPLDLVGEQQRKERHVIQLLCARQR
jgi:hypothetical protein